MLPATSDLVGRAWCAGPHRRDPGARPCCPCASRQRTRRVERRGVAADHDRQRAVAGADVAARDRVRRARRRRPSSARAAISTASAGRLVVMSTSRPPGRERAEHAVGPEHHLLDLAGVADHHEHDVARGGDRGGGVGPRRAPRRRSASALARVRVVTVTGCPASSRCPHMLDPMTPVPIQPIRSMAADSGTGRRNCTEPRSVGTLRSMLSDGTLVIDADSHFTERHDLFTELAPAKYKDRVPRVEEVDGIPTWVFDGHVLGQRQRRRGHRPRRQEGERRPRAQPLDDRRHPRRGLRPEGAPRGARRVRHRRADHLPEHDRSRRPGPRHGRRPGSLPAW